MKKMVNLLTFVCLTQIYQLESTEYLIKTFNGPIKNLTACGFFGDAVAIPSDDNALTLRYLDNDDSITLTKGSSMIKACCASRSGNYFATGDYAGMLSIYEVPSQKIVDNNLGKDAFQKIAFSGDDTTCLTLSWGNAIEAYRIKDGDRVFYKKPSEQVVTFSPGPNQTKLGVAFKDHAELWTIDEFSGHTVDANLDHDGGIVYALDYNLDGKSIASGSHDSVKIWETESGKPLSTIRGLRGICAPLSHSPDGNYLAVGSFDETITVYDLRNMQDAVVLAGHGGGADALAWKAGGTELVSCSNRDKTVKVWDIRKPVGKLCRWRQLLKKCRELTSRCLPCVAAE